MRAQIACFVVAFVAVALMPRAGRADARAEARAKLVQGGEALKSGQYEEALARFQEAYKLVPSPKIHYNFGLAYRGLGRKGEALEAFERFLAQASDASKETRQAAEKNRAQLLAQVTVLEVKSDVEGAEIVVDGRTYGTKRTTPIYLDPGPHQLVVEKEGEGPPFTERLNAVAGERINILARLGKTRPLDTGASRAPPPPPPPLVEPQPGPDGADTPPAQSGPRWQPVLAWGAAGGAALALGFGTYQFLAANSTFNRFNTTKGCGETLHMYGGWQCTKLYEEGSSQRTWSIVGFVAGGVLATASVLLFVMTPDEPAGEVSLSCVPSLTPGGGPGLACGTRF